MSLTLRLGKKGGVCKGLDAGFTLVEVLIASLILFSVLTVGTMAYRTSVRLFEKITISAVISGALPDIMALVKESLMERKNSGEAPYNKTIHYSWKASEINLPRISGAETYSAPTTLTTGLSGFPSKM